MNLIYPGSFDPITVGHRDIVERISKTFKNDKITVIIANNRNKNHTFSIDERKKMVEDTVKDISDNIKVIVFDGVISDYIVDNNIDINIRGIRNYTDLEYEKGLEVFTTETTNAETIYLTPKPEHSSISSSLVRDFINLGKKDKINKFVPPSVLDFIQKKEF